jgi:hypothetical protein
MFSTKIYQCCLFAALSILQPGTAVGQVKKKPILPKTTAPVVAQLPVPADSSKTDPFLENLLQQYPQYFDSILKQRKTMNVQFIYTSIDRGINGMAALKNYYFNLQSNAYFYPASAVKLPIAMLTLQRLNELKATLPIGQDSTMITGQAYSGQTEVINDPTTIDGQPSIAHYLKKMLMVSDNDAYNRLYEFLGQQYINDQLYQKGYTSAQVLHRMDVAMTPDENRHTNPVKFLGIGNKLLYNQPAMYNTRSYPTRKDFLGKAYWQNGKVVAQPMDFSLKNRMSLEDLHTILIGLVFPNKVHAAERYNLTDTDRRFLLKYMSQLPTESRYPPYSSDTATYFPAYSKMLLVGAAKKEWPKNIRIFNKVGEAYGQLVDVAYIVDFDKKIEFFLSAVIYCNKDGVLNDDVYDYEKVGYPFMQHLGEVIYNYELNRTHKILPDLSGVRFEYDKK